MKKELLILAILFTLLLVTSCEKEKPTAGEYFGTFTYEVPPGILKTAYIEISNPTKNSITINGYEVSKDDQKIEGMIDYLSGVGSYIYINGSWSHKLFSNEYIISGTFTETYYQGGNQYQNSGTFEIKSN